jgi:hypothetical protein
MTELLCQFSHFSVLNVVSKVVGVHFILVVYKTVKLQNVIFITIHFLVTKLWIEEYFIAFINSIWGEGRLHLWQQNEEDREHSEHHGWMTQS